MASKVKVRFEADTRDLERGTKRAGSSVGGLSKRAIAGAAGFVSLGAALRGSIDEARESIKVGAQTNAVLKSTGGVANVSAKEVGALATALSLKTGMDDEAIQSGENLLLTFRNVRNETGRGNDIFNQTTKIVADMSVGLKTDLKSAAILAGKALNDPVRGLTVLSRVGVTFTEGQKKQIKALVESGQTMKAQKIILRELNSEFAGSAAAQADPFDRAKVAVDNLKESIGLSLMPAIGGAADGLAGFIGQMQAGKGFGGGLVRRAKDVVDDIKAVFQSATTSFGGGDDYFSTILGDNRSIGTKIAEAIQAGIQQANIGQVISNAIRGGGQGNSGEFVAQTILDFLKTILDPGFWIKNIGTVITIALMATRIGFIAKIPLVGPALERFGAFLLSKGGAVIGAAGRFLGSGLWNAIKGGLSRIGPGVATIFDALPGFLARNSTKAISEGAGIGGKIGIALLRALRAIGSKTLDAGRYVVKQVGRGMIAAVGFVASGAQDVLNTIGSKLSRWAHTAWQKGVSIITHIASGLRSGLAAVANIGESIGRALINAAKSALGIHSPSREFAQIGKYMMLGLAKEINPGNVGGFLQRAFGGTGNFVKKLVGKGLASVGDLPGKFAGLFGGGGKGGLGSFEGVSMAKWIVPALQYARAHGWQGHVTSGYRSQAKQDAIRAIEPRAAVRSNHTYGGAIDVGGFGDFAAGAALKRALAGYKGKQLVWGPDAGNQDGGHFSFNGHARGGKVMEPSYIAGEEAPRYPEYILSTNPRDRSRSTSLWMEAARDLAIPGYKKSGKHAKAKRTSGKLVAKYISNAEMQDAKSGADGPGGYEVNLQKRLAAIDKLLARKYLKREDKIALLNARGQVLSAIADATAPLDAPVDGASSDGGAQALADAINANTAELVANREYAQRVTTARKSITDTAVQGMIDGSLGGMLTDWLLTNSPRMAMP